MGDHWPSLVANLAVVALFISAWVHGQFVLAGQPRLLRNIAFGAVLGAGAVASMLLSFQIDGALFDLRQSLVVLSAFFGGPVAGLVAVAIAAGFRILVIGGPLAISAGLTMFVTMALGLVVSVTARNRIPSIATVVVLAVCVGVANFALSSLLRPAANFDVALLQAALAVMNALATALCAFFIMRNRVIVRERDLFLAAFKESPDYQYVKTADSRFAAVNMNVTLLNGFAAPAEMVGKTDFDITSFERAKSLMLAEQKIVETGEPLVGYEEALDTANGEVVWYTTSKVPLHNADGDIVGIAGVTRDITARRRMRQEVEDSRNQLNYVLSEVSDGIAMFDAQGTLVYRNEQYCDFFPLTAAVRRSGQHIRDILAAVAETGEQRGIPEGAHDRWVNEIADTLEQTGEQEIQLFNNRWLHIRTRPTANGAALVVVSDVTTIKEAEEALLGMTEQLKMLATTDGLTSLTNRRAFDDALELELARSRRTMQPLALLMIDVDRFKAYNDIYGHQAGDAVLKQVALCLKSALKRPGDIVARYGGEEFVAILPGTEEDGAFFIADNFRESLRALNLPHNGGDRGVVTASIGIAVFTERDMGMNATELVRRADEALYNAKGAGRDRVTGWRPRSEIRAVRKN